MGHQRETRPTVIPRIHRSLGADNNLSVSVDGRLRTPPQTFWAYNEGLSRQPCKHHIGGGALVVQRSDARMKTRPRRASDGPGLRFCDVRCGVGIVSVSGEWTVQAAYSAGWDVPRDSHFRDHEIRSVCACPRSPRPSESLPPSSISQYSPEVSLHFCINA